MRLQRRRWHRHRYQMVEGHGIPTPFDTWIGESLAGEDAYPFQHAGNLPGGERTRAAKARVLIAEDDRDTREVLAFYLSSIGYEALTATCGSTAIDLAQRRHPDLLLTDLTMPNVDGIELIERLRSDGSLNRLPILAMTAHGAEKRERAMAAGADACLAKPLDFANLAQAIEGILA